MTSRAHSRRTPVAERGPRGTAARAGPPVNTQPQATRSEQELRTRIFVYGTLLTAERNHRYLGNARFVADARTEPAFRLYDLGAFPGLVAVGDQAIVGEVYEVDEPTLAMLDQLEGHPRFYVRKSIALEAEEAVQSYLLMPHQVIGRPIIASGSWRAHRKGTPT